MSNPLVLENGFDCCVFCWQAFGGEGKGVHPGIGGGINYTYGPVVHAETGREFDHVGASEGGTPLAHPDCYKEYAELLDTENTKLSAFAGGNNE